MDRRICERSLDSQIDADLQGGLSSLARGST